MIRVINIILICKSKMALRRVFRAFVCAYRGMDGKFHRAKKPFVVFWVKSSGVLVGRDDVHGVVLSRDGTRSVRRVRRARQRRGKSDVRIVCVGQVFVRIVPCTVFRGKKSPAWTCHNDCHFGVNVDFLYFYSAIPRGETCKSRRSRPAFMVFVSVVAVLRRRDYKLKKGRRLPPSPNSFILSITFSSVAFFTKHLTIIDTCRSAFAPWFNMVAFHILYIKYFTTYGTYAILPFVSTSFLTFCKRTNIQVFFVSGQNIWINSFLFVTSSSIINFLISSSILSVS